MEYQEKKCKTCDIILTDDNVAWKNKTQWRGICKKCRSRSVGIWQKENPEVPRRNGLKHRRKVGIGIDYPCLVCGKMGKRVGAPHVCCIKCRFFYYVKTSKGCWIWEGIKGRGGYGKTFKDGKTMSAHRLSYEIFKGPIPDGLLICHSCDNPKCVNPSHLWAGTHQENTDDMMRKKRNYSPKRKKNA